MKYIDEYRDKRFIEPVISRIFQIITRSWNIMEICGGQTHAILKYNLTSLLPKNIVLIHGPGCPVCVTPAEKIDMAIALAKTPGVIFTSFGDMLRVPGNYSDLLRAKAEGADVRIVYSPLDCIPLAMKYPNHQIVFFGIGFETTAPVNALALYHAYSTGVKNFSILCSQVLVPPAIKYILSAPSNRVNGILAAGHVCTITGFEQYHSIARDYNIPISVTGFEPLDIVSGILAVITHLEQGQNIVTNEYTRSVTESGNAEAQKILNEVFEVSDQHWRGIGTIPQSGLIIRERYKNFDAEIRFNLTIQSTNKQNGCMAGEILKGNIKPFQCPAFDKVCTPEKPMGAPMVSNEGACAAYYRYNTNHYGNKLSHTYSEPG